jgi:uncharacterized protein YbjT (DUF2867 family)
MPNSFFQNDCWLREAMPQHGVYPQPMARAGANRVDVRDIAVASANALLEEGREGERYPLVGPDVLTGPAVAETWSRHLGKPIAYVGDDFEAWATGARGMMPEWLVNDLRTMFRILDDKGLVATDEDFARQQRLLRRAPRRFDDFVAETARQWLSVA